MQTKTLSAGDPIESRCTKCRKITNHIIVAMDASGPARVQCNTCSGQHKYRRAVAAKSPVNRQAAQQRDAACQEWESLRPSMDVNKALAYAMTDSYKVKSLINHPIFGLGLVQRVVGAQKVEVLFADGRKTMRCK
jgi:hypothetical protein